MTTSTYPPGLAIAILLGITFLVCALDLAHAIALGYGGVMAAAHVSRARWRR